MKSQENATDMQAGTPKSHRNSPQQNMGNDGSQQVAPSPNNNGNAPTPANTNGNMMNGGVGDNNVANGNNNNSNNNANNNANNNNGGNNNNTTSLFGGDIMGDTSLFGADGDLDWVSSVGGAEGIDFAQYLENMGEDNEGEVGVAGG